MLLLAGLGIGAFMLYTNKSNAQSKTADVTTDGNNADTDIPAAPKILAVNNTDSESPLPTGIVNDEEGMEATNTPGTQPRQTTYSPTNEDSADDDDSGNSGASSIPPLISTKLTPKEKAIIDRGQLTNDLAIQRPDLYKAIYIRKHGSKGNGQKALLAADEIISRIQMNGTTAATSTQKKRRRVAIKLHPHTGKMVKAAQSSAAHSTAHPAHQLPAGKSAATRKPTVRPGSKGTRPQRKVAHHPVSKKHTVAHHKGQPHRKP